jgi:hypothetical protein
MKTYVHARLTKAESVVLEELKKATGQSESELVRRGLRLVHEAVKKRPSALDLAGKSTGKFKKGPADLSTNTKHLEGLGK